MIGPLSAAHADTRFGRHNVRSRGVTISVFGLFYDTASSEPEGFDEPIRTPECRTR